MTSRYVAALVMVLGSSQLAAQVDAPLIRVAPASVNVRSDGATTAILTFSGLGAYLPAEGQWCGRLGPSSGRGLACDPRTIYAQALRAVGAQATGGVFTDVMSVPASVAQKANVAARAGESPRFYFVRRFRAASAAMPYAADQYVAVACLLGGGGANAPFTLTAVRLRTPAELPVTFVARGGRAPAPRAEIEYTGTGRLRGRWEIVMPGEELPRADDLMTEGSLAPAARALQRRYREVGRFNVMLLPTGRFTLSGPDPDRLPTAVEGTYLLLLRVEASDDPRSTRVVESAAGMTVIQRGAAAAFPMPTLRYVVGATQSRAARARIPQDVRLQLPLDGALVSSDSAPTLRWSDARADARHRVELEDAASGVMLLSALVAAGVDGYAVPPFVLARTTGRRVRWRVVALSAAGLEVGRSASWQMQLHVRP